MNSLSKIAFGEKNYKAAIEYGQKGLDAAHSIKAFEEAARLSATISEAYQALGLYRNSLEYYKTYLSWKDSLNALTIQQKLEQYKSNQEVLRKQEQISLLEKERENQVLLRNSLFSGVVFTIILLTLAVNRYFVKRRSERQLQRINEELSLAKHEVESANKCLSVQNEQIQQQNDELAIQSQQIQIKNTELQENLETLRRTQTQLAQAEKMASLGTLVAGVAHELNTPIGVAVTAASTLQSRTNAFVQRFTEGGLKKSELEAFVETAQIGADLTLRNLERAANLIQSFKQVAVDQTSDTKRRFKLRHYLEGVITSLEPKWKTTRHRVEIACDETLEMETYPGAIAQIITNLIDNSLLHGFQGFTEEGIMRIVVEHQAPTNQVTITYSDNGQGIPTEVLPRIFDPFFTTKQAQGGTGLGWGCTLCIIW